MSENLTVNMENLTEEERKTLVGLIEKANKEEKVWKPSYEDKYWFIDSKGEVYSSTWYNDETDEYRYLIGNCFKTKEEAEEKAKSILINARYKKLATESGECDWENDSTKKFYCWFGYISKDVNIGCDYNCKGQGITYFTSEESLKSAIAEIGEDDFKKYVLEVDK